MAKQEFIRGTRSRAPYGYSREGKPNRGPETNLLSWILVILLLTAVAIVAWIFPAYVFRNPHIAFNYELLRKIDKLEPLEQFSSTKPPKQRERHFYTAREIFEKESGRPADQLVVMNDLQKRLYVQNFEGGDMVGFMWGEFEVVDSRVLGEDDLFPGLALLAKSKEFPNTLLEYLLPIPVPFENPYKKGHVLNITKGGDLCAILHLTQLSGDKLSATVLCLTYAVPVFPDQDLPVAVPENLNLRANWPVFSSEITAKY